MPLVSVVIPTFNRAGPVARAVDSVLAQTGPGFELIVVDDGSTDETGRVLGRYGEAIKVLRQDRAGVGAARNRGIEASRGDLIAFLDSDDYWLPEKLALQTAFFQAHPDALICQTEEIWIRGGRRVNPKARHRKPSGDVFVPSLELCLISPSAVMMRRSLFDRVGLFDEDLPACEDYDLWLRVSARWPVHLLDHPLVVKTGGHADQLSRTVPALDRFRVQALRKIIQSGRLTPLQVRAARQVLARKARVYGQGCLKRGRVAEAEEYMELARANGPETLADDNGPAEIEGV
ncbi:MAG: glycosyltransferase [Proteobacteria bacterium]|nr:glycosyltransferase [Pseudomonadota bacterium]